MKNVFNVLIVPVFLLFSLKERNNLVQNKHSEAFTAKSERIIYLFFKADKDQSGNAKITLQSTKIADGRLKQMPSFERNNIRKGDLVITLTGADGKEMGKQLVKDPFNPELEVYEKEGISRHKASLQNTEFSARFSYSENVQSVKIEKATEDGAQVIFTQKL
ncbi:MULTISPECIES: hypothetical protein [Chryseobacterium]|uniref:hypothetical protein n=1 Tax=Chryseobacterium TaxID=59732 RepID=UPI000D945096|nr:MULTISPECIES: hypothetical protein [Chryseobacterium]PWW17137.1 hypothetical protein DEU40_12752 [Chryseobacterium sp. AG844]QRA43720.1 hypothetical protein JNG87_02915 [Chryseobacterium cucumeris]